MLLRLFKADPFSRTAVRPPEHVPVPAPPFAEEDAPNEAPACVEPLTPEIAGPAAQRSKWVVSPGEAAARADLRGKDLCGADLRDALLRKADLTGADLFLADLRGACLIQANLRGANLLGAQLQEAALQGASLDGVIGLRAEQLARANLSGASLPWDVTKTQLDGLKSAGRVSLRARHLFLVMLLASLAVTVIATATTDVQLLQNAPVLPIAILGRILPANSFFLLAPFALLCLYVGFHLSLQRQWERLAELPAVFPDGIALDQKGPWLLMNLARDHFRWVGDDRLACSPLEVAALILPAYWVVPLTLVFVWARHLTRLDLRETMYHVALIAGAAALGTFLPRHLAGTFHSGSSAAKAPRRGAPSTKTRVQIGALAALGILLTLVSFGAVYGAPYNRGTREFAALDPRAWAPRVLWSFGYSPYAALADADISTKPAHWTGRDEQLAMVRGARLDRSSLRYADARGAFLAVARLTETDLREADLTEADLRDADLHRAKLKSAVLDRAQLNRASLHGATLVGASLMRTDLRDADLSYADLHEARLVDARLAGAVLYAADLREAMLLGASLEKADLREANLQQANLSQANLRKAYLWSANLRGVRLHEAQMENAILIEADLRGALLHGAMFQGAILRGALLDGADIEDADLRGAVGLSVEQLCATRGRSKALLDDDLAQQLASACSGRSGSPAERGAGRPRR